MTIFLGGSHALPSFPIRDIKKVFPFFRFPNSKRDEEQEGKNLVDVGGVQSGMANSTTNSAATRIVHDSIQNVPLKMRVSPQRVSSYLIQPAHPSKTSQVSTSATINVIPTKPHSKGPNFYLKEADAKVEQISSSTFKNKCAQMHSCIEESGIRHIVPPISSPLQINEVTSSDDEKTPPPVPQRPPGGYGAANKRRSLCRELADLQVNASSIMSGKF